MLLGNRYGYRPFPARINVDEFELLLDISIELNLAGHEILREWFKKDENNIPSEYILQVFNSSGD